MCIRDRDKLRVLLDQGVDCFKTDFGERIPTDVVYYDGSDPELMHNSVSYTHLLRTCSALPRWSACKS